MLKKAEQRFYSILGRNFFAERLHVAQGRSSNDHYWLDPFGELRGQVDSGKAFPLTSSDWNIFDGVVGEEILLAKAVSLQNLADYFEWSAVGETAERKNEAPRALETSHSKRRLS